MDQMSQTILEDDKLTEKRRKFVKEKISLIYTKDENIDELLISLEAYCTIVLITLK